MNATLVRSEQETPQIRTFWFKPEKRLRFVAGQFTELRLPHINPDIRGQKRWFTISSSPTQEFVSVTTRLDPIAPSSFKQALFNLQPGAPVHLAEPMGDFVLPQKKDIPVVFIAGGIGVTPMHSMVQWLKDMDEKRHVRLFYASNKLDEIAFRDTFESAPIKFDIILGSPPKDWPGMSGRLTSEMIIDLPGVRENALIYISGPEPMVEQFYSELQNKGIPKYRLVMDYFPGYTETNI